MFLLMLTTTEAELFVERFAAVWRDVDVNRWSANDDALFIEFTLSGTFGGRPISWDAVDRFTLIDGLVAERVSYFDSTPLALKMALRPRGWPRLLRSGFRPGLS